ncbi:outer membrane lipoprotein-sorting protein [Natronoflexus pectinivorans]|uniref:Outer membrane lipoprotein-sorting protein n=1 Tax=Natronoflexus pectinivorans TaxID=682526 RepID=A0A4R2GM68_9BACT|nr:outer membrane lipoprotein-sorting protein [Natronoflexus pectinivorans]TCO09860.1 outer membrane lipoprotein-sorting protein [Natronoflexus pectinivorans]
MKKEAKLTRTILTIGLLVLTVSSATAQDPKEIIRRMEDNMRGDASYSEMTMKTVRPRYTREITMKSWALGDDYSLILVTAPARDQGTSFLKRGNEIWNYVPNIDRTVKMPPSMMSQSWMGSDFTNDDLVRGTSSVDDYDHKLLGSETIDGVDCYKIEMIPHPETPVVYEKVIYWVSKSNYLPVKLENYDEYQELVSTILFREVKKLGGREIPTIMEMIPQERDGHRTIITTHKMDFSINLNRSFFSQQNMRNVR